MSLFSDLPSEPALAAQELARRGLAIFPCSASTKRPLTKNGFKDASADPQQVEVWWRQHHNALIGLPTGTRNQLWVLDADRKHGDPDELIESVEHECDARFRGPRVATLHDGRHVYFSHDPRIRIGASGFKPGIDWRGEGGYVIAPDGKRYHLVSDGEIEPAPEALIVLVVGAQGRSASNFAQNGLTIPYQRTAFEHAANVHQDGRWHDSMVRLVWGFVQRGLSVDEITDLAPLFMRPGYSLGQTQTEIRTAALGAFEKQNIPPAGALAFQTSVEDADRLQFSPYVDADLAGIPARRWVYAHYLIRSYISVLGAPGGIGKTAQAVAVALAVASGKPLLKQAVHERAAVIFANLEDPLDEMQRRIGAAMRLHGLTQDDIEDRILLLSGRDQGLIVAERTREGMIVSTPIVDRCIREIRERNVGLFIVDPFVASHALEENRNDQVNFAAQQWRRIAHETQCSVLLSHHFRKGSNGDGGADQFRGASALVDAARAAVSLAPLRDTERDLFGLTEEQGRGIIRMDDAKLNLAPRPDRANWYELVSVQLPNGDNVQAVRVWEPPSKWEGLTMEIVTKILNELERGYDADTPYAPTRNAGERWGGRAISSVASECDVSVSDEKAASILKEWIENEVLQIKEYEKPNRTKGKGLYVNPAKRPSAAPGASF